MSLKASQSWISSSIFLRHKVKSHQDEPLEKVSQGFKQGDTQLYSIWGTPYSDLGDFGLAIGVYFYTCLSLVFVMFVAGVMNIPNIMYYWSSDYDSSQLHVSVYLSFFQILRWQ